MTAEEEKYITQLRDCFNAGYQFPQYCIDNNIKKPLFVGTDEGQKTFLWEIYIQFKYYRFIPASFAFATPSIPKAVNFTVHFISGALSFQDYFILNLDDFDKVIILANDMPELKNDKSIFLSDLCKFFFQKTYCDIPLLHYMQKHAGVKLIVTNFPVKPTTNPEAEKKYTYILAQLANKLRHDKSGKVKTLMDWLGYSNAEVLRMITWPGKIGNADGSVTLKDINHPLMHVKNGLRATAYQPERFKNTIYFFGISHQYGLYAPDDRTLESYLQKMLNDNNLPYKVENRGGAFMNAMQNTFYNLNVFKPLPGDIVFIYLDRLMPLELPSFDVRHVFDNLDYAKYFADKTHLNEHGYKILAEKYFDYLTENDFFKHTNFEYPPPVPHTSSLWYTARKYHRRNKIFAEQRAGRLQSKVA